MERLARELRKLIEGRISDMRMDISAGFLNDISEYRKATGQIDGLRAALDLLDEAISNINKN